MNFVTVPPKFSLPELTPLALRCHHSPAALQRHPDVVAQVFGKPGGFAASRSPTSRRQKRCCAAPLRSLSISPPQDKHRGRVGGVSSEQSSVSLSLGSPGRHRCVVVTNSVRSPVVHVRRTTRCDSALVQAPGLLGSVSLPTW